jgi:hypothetical protein
VIDVSRFKRGAACPRCVGRRVYVVDEDANLWCCIPSGVPVPWRREQVLEHDAGESDDDSTAFAAAQRRSVEFTSRNHR